MARYDVVVVGAGLDGFTRRCDPGARGPQGARDRTQQLGRRRAGEQTINLTVDPERASALIAKAKSAPGVTAVGWTSGAVEMDHRAGTLVRNGLGSRSD